MKIELIEVPIRDIVSGYENNEEEGVVAFDGRLNVRPPYQREFVYKDKQRDEVIKTIRKGFPLNVMYWVLSAGSYKIEKDKEGNANLILSDDAAFEILDGQQRTISFCQYYIGDFSVDFQFFHNLLPEEKEQFLNYKAMIYFCEGTDREKLDWFRTINIAGEKLFDQELRNAVYSGSWVTDAKRYFSKTGCAAYNLGKDYLAGTCIRQDYLETTIDWIASRDKETIEGYMAIHQHDENASIIWQYYQNVINWVKSVFPVYRKEMKGVEWGFLFNKYKDTELNATELENRIKVLMLDEDISNKSGIYEYVLDGEEKHLSIRAFTPKMKREAYERQNGICAICHNHFDIEEMEADHIDPWHSGGATIASNCQMLCKPCNRRKSGS